VIHRPADNSITPARPVIRLSNQVKPCSILPDKQPFNPKRVYDYRVHLNTWGVPLRFEESQYSFLKDGAMQSHLKMSPEEQAIYDGRQGATLQKVIRSVVAYGDIFHASHLEPIEGMSHMVTSFGANTIKPYFKIIDEVLQAGLSLRQPFTVDPRPMEFETLNPGPLERIAFSFIFGQQKNYEEQLQRLGLKDAQAFSCACYLPEVGNIPRHGAMLAWSESSAVVYANSVLGARSNRNSGGIDLMCSLLGKAPYFGLLTDEGRKASWKIEVRTACLPNAQLLGSAIGLKVMEDVPYITGLEQHLGKGIQPHSAAYLKDMGAASASNGAVGLYHIEGITPEAVDSGEALLKPGYKTFVIDEIELQRVMDAYPLLWKNAAARPRLIFIGCPHLSTQQIGQWADAFQSALSQTGQARVKTPVYLSTAPDVAEAYRAKQPAQHQRLLEQGIHLTTICPLMYMTNPLCGRHPVVTNSNKLRTYSTARFFPDEDVLRIAISGKVPQGGQHD
jgi:predicted aconitase